MKNTSARVAMLDAGLGRKEDAIREARHAVDLMPIAKDSLNGPAESPTSRWFTRGQASATARLSNSKSSRRSRTAPTHTAISASIRAGILCAVISASTKSSPQPKLPADSWKRRRCLVFYSAHAKHCYQRKLLVCCYASSEKICNQSGLNKAMRRTSWCLSPTMMSSTKSPSSSKPNRLLRLILRILMSREWM